MTNQVSQPELKYVIPKYSRDKPELSDLINVNFYFTNIAETKSLTEMFKTFISKINEDLFFLYNRIYRLFEEQFFELFSRTKFLG